MAADLVTGAASFLVKDLLQLDQKLKAMTGIKEKMEKLKELSTTIDTVIQDIESRPSTEDAVKDLLKKLKYLAYDVEDAVDYYDTKVLQKKQRSSNSSSLRPVRDFFSSDNQVMFMYRAGSMIKAITESLDSILLQKSILLSLPQDSIRMSELSLHRETPARNSWDVKGRDTEKQMIIDMLTEDDDGDESKHGTLKVIAIVGMGGLGKTTLAQLVFNDEKVKAHFACSTVWTVIGAESDPTKMMKSILEAATDAPVNISQIDSLKKNIEKTFSGKRFLLVLDDVWNEDPLTWGILKAALTCGAKGSKILVTTRSQQVSLIMDSSNTTHQIQQLSGNDCLHLFEQFAFGDEAVDQKLMEIGEKIIEKCGGVPLAAISLGSMLRSTREEAYWSSVLKSEIWQLRNEEDKVLAVLKLSYDTLPPRSKKCFAFASLFPKNYRMTKDELIKLWMANGLVCSEGNFDAETNGNRVFDDLVLRSFFLLVPSAYVTKCTMHDLMHDLARSISTNVYWNSKQDSVEDMENRTYHLHLYLANASKITQAIDKKPMYLRTLILNCCRLHQNANLLEIVFSELKFLRVLDLSNNEIREVPTSIGNLIHLRYLNLSGNNIEILPDSITLLFNLQFLYFDFRGSARMPCGLSRLTNLRSLPVFVVDNRSGACSIIELEDLKLHGEMTIQFSENFTNYSCGGRKILKNKELNQLRLEFNCSESNDKDMLDDLCPNMSLKKLTILKYGSQQFPAWLMESRLPNFVEVRLVNCHCKLIPPFGNLKFLKKLELQFINGITRLGAEFHGCGGFPSLQELYLKRMDNLEEWSECHGAFPSLQRLRVDFCPKLKNMPRLPRIQHLEISCYSGSLLSCIGSLTSLSILKLEMHGVPYFPSGCIKNLTSLKELQITERKQLHSLTGDETQDLLSCIGNLTSLSVLKLEKIDGMTSFPSGCIGNLTSLKELQITECKQVQSLPGDEMQHLKMLRLLTIKGCPSIILQPEELVQILNSVHQFQIQICGKKVNLRGQLQHLHTVRELCLCGGAEYKIKYGIAKLEICCCDELESLMTAEPASNVLEKLYIDGFFNLRTLPHWLQHLKSLSLLSIENCPRLESVPDLKNLHMLKSVRVFNCPRLERCEMKTCKD